MESACGMTRCSGVRALNTGVIVLLCSGVFGRIICEGPETMRSDGFRFKEGGVIEEDEVGWGAEDAVADLGREKAELTFCGI